jgi:hypothetical protein
MTCGRPEKMRKCFAAEDRGIVGRPSHDLVKIADWRTCQDTEFCAEFNRDTDTRRARKKNCATILMWLLLVRLGGRGQQLPGENLIRVKNSRRRDPKNCIMPVSPLRRVPESIDPQWNSAPAAVPESVLPFFGSSRPAKITPIDSYRPNIRRCFSDAVKSSRQASKAGIIADPSHLHRT